MDMEQAAVKQNFSMMQMTREQEKKGVNREHFPEEPLWRLLKAQKDKDQYVINYVNFAYPELVARGIGDGPPGLQGEPDPETEEDEMRIPSYEAWKGAYWKWVEVGYGCSSHASGNHGLYQEVL